MEKVDDNWVERVEEALTTRLYLLNDLGPTKLLFRDDEKNKFKISIGQSITCSCKSNDRCSHILFALIKVFKVSRTSDLLFKEKLSDLNINEILEGRYKVTPQQSTKEEKEKFNYLRRKGTSKSSLPKKREIDPSDACSICYDDLGSKGLHSCKTCENAFHIKCIKMYLNHQQTTNINAKPKCPMCRSVWVAGTTLIKKLEIQEIAEKNKDRIHKGNKCFGCNVKTIVGVMYSCLWCPAVKLCSKCFDKGIHSSHSHFVMKESPKATWKPATARLEAILSGISLEKYIIKCIPSCIVNDSVWKNQSPSGLEIIGFQAAQRDCGICCRKKGSLLNIKRTPCSHIFCIECLNLRFYKGNFNCPDCDTPIFRGLPSDLSFQKETSDITSNAPLSNKRRPPVEKRTVSARENKDKLDLGIGGVGLRLPEIKPYRQSGSQFRRNNHNNPNIPKGEENIRRGSRRRSTRGGRQT